MGWCLISSYSHCKFLVLIDNYYISNAFWNKRSCFLTCWGESCEDPQLYEGIHVFSMKKVSQVVLVFVSSDRLMALTFHMYTICPTCNYLTSTVLYRCPRLFTCTNLNFLYMARIFRMHQLSFTWRGLFTCINFLALHGADFSHVPISFRWRGLFTCTRFPLHGADFSHVLILL